MSTRLYSRGRLEKNLNLFPKRSVDGYSLESRHWPRIQDHTDVSNSPVRTTFGGSESVTTGCCTPRPLGRPAALRPGDNPTKLVGFGLSAALPMVAEKSGRDRTMPGGPSAVVLKDLYTLFQVGTAGGLTDSQLIERFLNQRDDGGEAAFRALVERHAPMVLRVCHDVVGDWHEAEDAAQATFIVLACKAGSIRKRDSAASWLFGVACRIAAQAKAKLAHAAGTRNVEPSWPPPRCTRRTPKCPGSSSTKRSIACRNGYAGHWCFVT